MHHKIHINQHNIRGNAKHGHRTPVVTIKGYRTAAHRTHCQNIYAHEAEILDPEGRVVARLRYSPECPLPCGAKVWLETDYTVRAVVWPDPAAPGEETV